MRTLLARVLGVREDEVDDVVRHDRRGAERVLGRRGFLGAVAAVAASSALLEPVEPAGLIQLVTAEQVVAYSFPGDCLVDLGYSSRKVIAAFVDAYRLQLRNCQRFSLVDERLLVTP